MELICHASADTAVKRPGKSVSLTDDHLWGIHETCCVVKAV